MVLLAHLRGVSFKRGRMGLASDFRQELQIQAVWEEERAKNMRAALMAKAAFASLFKEPQEVMSRIINSILGLGAAGDRSSSADAPSPSTMSQLPMLMQALEMIEQTLAEEEANK